MVFSSAGIRVLRFFFVFFMVHLFTSGQVLAERVYLDITASDVRKVVVAIPDFAQKGANPASASGKEMAELLSQALDFHGFVDIIDSEKYGGKKETDWKALGADYVFLGQYDTTGSGLLIEGRILDVSEDRMLAGRRYRGSVKQQDDMILRLCDAIVEEFTGESGISRSRIAFVSDASGRKEVYLSDPLGRTVKQITRHRHLVVSPRFSADGRYLSYSSYHSGNQNLYVTDLNQDKVTKALSRHKGMNMAPAWSPDGEKLIITLSKDGSPDLYLMTSKGQILDRITSGAGINVSPSWSPDGQKITFVSDRSGTPQVYVMDMKSRRTQRLTFQGKENTEPSWSPKGDLIAYSRLVEGQYHIFTMDPENLSSAKQITSDWGDFESPSWSPDGKQIILSRRRNGHQQICSIQKNGKGMRVLFESLKGNQSYPQWSSRLQ
jgi:TolB protein